MSVDNDYQMITLKPGQIADVITHLEMKERPELPETSSNLMIAGWAKPDADAYLKLFRDIGEDWLWLSRLLLNREELLDIIHHDDVHICSVTQDGKMVGVIELDFRVAGESEIAFFGLIKEMNGQGHGQWLMNQTLNMAWRADVKRVWLHTCTLDSPFALNFYQKRGFKAFKREVSINIDPRIAGHLPESAAPQIPLIR